MATLRYAAYPTATLYDFGTTADREPPERLTPRKQLLWGDELQVIRPSVDGKYTEVFARNTHGWIAVEEMQDHRLLEVVFVDIGQGDGALMITPDNQRYLIDAGKGDNMLRFLRWRFGLKHMTTFDAAVLSHSDIDHYGGFDDLFKEANLHINCLYTNGLMERAASKQSDTLGATVTYGGKRYITDLVTNLEEFQRFSDKPDNMKGKLYPTMLAQAMNSGKFDDLRMLDATDAYLPGHEAGKAVTIKVLGPFPGSVDGKKALRWFGDVGKTKNGHSVVLHVTYHNVRIFLGGA